MEAAVAGWTSAAVRERWFRPGPRSALWLGPVRVGACGRVRLKVRYCWSDVGMWSMREKRLDILPIGRDLYLVNRGTLSDLAGLERACFEGVWARWERAALAELGVLPEAQGYLRRGRLAGA